MHAVRPCSCFKRAYCSTAFPCGLGSPNAPACLLQGLPPCSHARTHVGAPACARKPGASPAPSFQPLPCLTAPHPTNPPPPPSTAGSRRAGISTARPTRGPATPRCSTAGSTSRQSLPCSTGSLAPYRVEWGRATEPTTKLATRSAKPNRRVLSGVGEALDYLRRVSKQARCWTMARPQPRARSKRRWRRGLRACTRCARMPACMLLRLCACLEGWGTCHPSRQLEPSSTPNTHMFPAVYAPARSANSSSCCSLQVCTWRGRLRCCALAPSAHAGTHERTHACTPPPHNRSWTTWTWRT